MVGRSTWLELLVSALDRLLTLMPVKAAPEYTRIGAVRSDSDRGQGWFRFDGPAREVRLERLGDAVLAPKAGPQERKYAVIESLLDDRTLLLKAGVASDTSLFLYAPAYDKRELTTLLRDGLKQLPKGSLAERFDTRTLDVPTGPLPASPRLDPAQLQALRACLSPGLQLIWGPPGTGKTHVIAEAIARIIEAGRTVLLVSTTNVAVDNAIQKATDHLNPPAGRIVRVGTPSVQAVAQDPRIALPILIQARQAELQRRIDDLVETIGKLGDDPRTRARTDMEQRLAAFDVDAYEESLRRVHREREYTEAKRELDAARADHDRLIKRRDELPGERALAEWARWKVLEQEAEAEIAAFELASERLRALGFVARLKKRKALALTERYLLKARAKHAEVMVGIREPTEKVLRHGRTVPDSLPPTTVEQTQQLVKDLFAEEMRLTTALTSSTKRLSRCRAAADALFAEGPMPQRYDRDLIASAKANGIDALLASRSAVVGRAEQVKRDLATASKEYEELQARAAKERGNLAAAIIDDARVIGSTLATFTLNTAVREKRYDYVIVDEAAFCRLPEVVHAVGRARTGAVLVGDFLQNQPIIDKEEREDTLVKPFFEKEAFGHFGITSPDQADRNPACLVLTEQRRFGIEINTLVNKAVYDGRLNARDPQGGEIVFIDVDGLSGNLSNIYRSSAHRGFWAIGALLAKALAEHHHHRNESFGVVVPYKDQEQATRRFLNDSPVGPAVDVGTAHLFQGREFDVVAFDLVDDGKGWMARASATSGDDWDLAGLRLFNVAVTRARDRVYVIGSWPALQKAGGGPLAVVKSMIDDGSIRLVKAAEVLGFDEIAPPPEDTAEHDVWEALRQYVRIIGQFDQVTVMTALAHALEHAKTRIWVWSPWVGKNQTLRTQLMDAVDRGVEVTLVTLPFGGTTDEHRSLWDAFVNGFTGRIVHVEKMHQKIVLIDHDQAFYGSMNLASAAKTPAARRKETMIEVRSRAFVEEIKRLEKTRELSQPPICLACGVRLTTADIKGRQPKKRWVWVCVCKAERPFDDAKPHQDSRWSGH